jgi:hypothetical protein
MLSDGMLRKTCNASGLEESATEGGFAETEDVSGAIFGGERPHMLGTRHQYGASTGQQEQGEKRPKAGPDYTEAKSHGRELLAAAGSC